MVVQIPVTNQPNQSFSVSLPQSNTNLVLNFYMYWNRIAQYWQISITNNSNSIELIESLPLIGALGFYQNLLVQWTYMQIGQLFIIPLSTASTESPGENDWGTNFMLVWGPN